MPFRAGAATSNITPALGVSLDGPIGQSGPATHVHDELHARCLVLDDGNTMLGIAVCDCTMVRGDVFAAAKEMVAEATGIPPSNLMLAATHSHSTPRAIGVAQAPLDEAYLVFLSHRIADGLRRARNQLAPARIGWGTACRPEHLHNRRWHMTPGSIPPNPFGEAGDQVKMNPRRASPDLLRPAGPVDPEIVVLSVQHADGRPLAVLANYGLHYVGGVPRGHVSADYYGMFAHALAARMAEPGQDPPFVGILSNGASGNVNNLDFRAPPAPLPPYTKMRAVAQDVATTVAEICGGIHCRDEAQLAAAATVLELSVRRPAPERVAWAHGVLEAAVDGGRLSLPEVFAREALLLSEYPECLGVPMQAFRIGDVGIAAIPCEVFAETGLAIKRDSPLEPSFVMGLANAYHGYLPTPEQHRLGGYETWPARSSCLAVDAETHIRRTASELLATLASRPGA